MDRRPPTRVVEEPKRSVVPFLALAIVAALVVWTVAQERIQDHSPSQIVEREQPQQPQQQPRLPPGGGKIELRTLFSADDYPAEAQRNGEEGTVQVALNVDPRGKVSGCTVIRSSGYASLDEATCSIIHRRARFLPARDAAGRPVPDRVVSPPITWRLEG